MEHKYFQFPLMLIRQLHIDPEEAKQNILRFALVDFALKQSISEEDAANQILYNFLRGGGLTEAVNWMGEATSQTGETYYEYRDEIEYAYFTEANKEDAISEVINTLHADSKLMSLAIQNCQLNKINKFFGVSGRDPDARLRDYKRLKKAIDAHEAKHGKEPRPTILKDLFFDLIEEPELLAFYVAIRSLEGPRPFTATNRPTIAGRAAGYKSAALLPKDNEVFKKFSNRYHFDKALHELINRSLVKSYLSKKHWRQFYLSTKLTPVQLGRAVAQAKIKRDVMKKKAEAMQGYLQLYNTTTI